MKKLAIIITHPIQYYSPLFQLLTKRNKIQIKVFYTWEQSQEKVLDKKFGKEIKWDIPLLSGYDYTFVKNTSKNPGSAHFTGVINPTLINEIKQWQAGALLVFGWNHHSHFKAMRYFKGKIPVYFRGDSTLLDEKKSIKTFARRVWLKFVYRYIDYAFHVGTNNKNYYLKHGLNEKQLIFAPHAIDNDRFNDDAKNYQKQALLYRKKLNISEQDIVFLFAGKFEPKKNPLILIETARYFPKYRFLFVGNGILEQEMKQKAGKNVLFLPFQNQSQMPIIYRIANVFVLPSESETWGLAVNEAMACAKAIITSDKVGCAVDLIKNGQNGYVFKANNIEDLKEKIELSTQNFQELGDRSETVIKFWSFTKIAEVIENVFV